MKNTNGNIDSEELKFQFQRIGLRVSNDEVLTIFNKFDDN